jgi:ABC-2 type transport system permease protein
MTRVDLGALAAGYLGVVLLGASFLALGLFASSLTENQIIAGVVGFALLLLFWVIGFAQELWAGGVLGRVMQVLSLTEHYDSFSKGVINTRELVYFASFIFFFLFLTKRQLESRRWRA